MQKFNPKGHSFPIYSRAEDCLVFKPVDLFQQKRKKDIVITATSVEVAPSIAEGMNMEGTALDFSSWLPFCARELHISPNPDDYILVPVVIMTSNTPNRNGVGFPLSALKQWSVEHGKLAFETWKGKPVHLEHDNNDPTKAYGVIVDSSIRKVIGFGNGKVWKVVLLLAIDRQKHPDIAQAILNGESNSYSMGAMVTDYSCSYCQAPMGKCNHVSLNNTIDFYEIGGKLVFRRVHGIVGFETSIVAVPAYAQASSDTILGRV